MDGKTVGIIATLFFLVGGFGVFVNTMPSEFFNVGGQPTYTEAVYPEYWNSTTMGNYQFILTDNITKGYGLTYWFDFNYAEPPYDVIFAMQFLPDITAEGHFNEPAIHMSRKTGQFLWHEFFSDMNFETQNNLWIFKDEIEANLGAYNASFFSPVFDAGISVAVWFADTNDTRNDVSLAFDEGYLATQIAFGYSNVTMSYDAWSLMGRIITFQAPEIFGGGGVGTLLNTLIALPLWAAIAALIAIFIFEILPF